MRSRIIRDAVLRRDARVRRRVPIKVAYIAFFARSRFSDSYWEFLILGGSFK
jgi:hypothetical protein